jgi:hypothetical protein
VNIQSGATIVNKDIHIPKYVSWPLRVAIILITTLITVSAMESCFLSRCYLISNLVLYIIVIGLIQAGKFIAMTTQRRAFLADVLSTFRLKRVILEASSFILEMLILFVLMVIWLPAYTALFYISMRISSLIVPSWVTVAVTIVPTSYVIGIMVRRAHRSKTLKSLRFMYHTIIVATLVLTATSTLVTVVTVELYYPVYIANIKNTYGAFCQLNTAWSIATKYLQDYYSTYGKAIPKPAQIFELRYSGIHWIYRRAFVLARTGSCGDIAIAVTTLLRDVLGCKTRVVVFQGRDHAVPELMVNGTWYVFDTNYTTPQYPVPANKYYEHLTIYYPEVASKITGFIEYETGEDVSLEHGFPRK